VTIFSCLRQYR